MRYVQTRAIATSIYMMGITLQGLPSSFSDLSFIAAARAAPPAVHRSAHRTVRPARRHTDVDIDVDGRGRVRDVDVDVDRYGRHRSVDIDVDRRPAVGVVAAAVAVGTRVARLPTGCTKVVIEGVTYQNCGGVYYRPQYEGTNLVYVVVEAP